MGERHWNRSQSLYMKNRAGLCGLWRTQQNVESEKPLNQDQDETLYYILVEPVLLYGSECWCLRKEDERRLLVTVMGRSRRNKIRNDQTRKDLGAEETVVERIRRRRLRW